MTGVPQASHIVPRARVRTGCRCYAAIVAITQCFLLGAIMTRGGWSNFFPYGVVGLTLLGSLLLMCNQPVGRSVFVPAAILQIGVLGFTAFIGLLSLLASWFQQSAAGMRQSAVFTVIAGGSALLLLIGVPLVIAGIARE